jgi:hypothetical protein
MTLGTLPNEVYVEIIDGEIVTRDAEEWRREELEKQRLVAINEIGARIGETHHRAKLTEADVEMIHALRDLGLSYRAIAGKFDDLPGGIAKSTVRDIIKCRIRAQRAVRWKQCAYVVRKKGE